MLYLLALILPPLAVLFAGRPFQAIFNGLLWFAGLVLLLMPFVPGLPLLGVVVVWALMVVHGRKQASRDQRLVDEALRRHDRTQGAG